MWSEGGRSRKEDSRTLGLFWGYGLPTRLFLLEYVDWVLFNAYYWAYTGYLIYFSFCLVVLV
ncbi:hypothetical protein BO85DRAFT_118200 [Aspergillus piperis CBS 112811]|uniref:Uncharacterized protein n=1 Tax=Aspergillus piperis CBS 112811 TaxID=1448313 RepID=A0A8G1VTH7_9EURO|nr:hypothetical protein BO85DRAFT_118200 [Aspergillus piperis CBS 112811]RAH61823.1 hypothetical protein BO85DRAFT_118200 [Aspergillus piperis CBS 112811]